MLGFHQIILDLEKIFLIYKKIMTIDDQIGDEKLQCDTNREAAMISALSSGKIGKYEYLAGEETSPSNQQQITEQAKFTYYPLGKAFEKQTITIEDQGKKQVETLKIKQNQLKEFFQKEMKPKELKMS